MFTDLPSCFKKPTFLTSFILLDIFDVYIILSPLLEQLKRDSMRKGMHNPQQGIQQKYIQDGPN